MSWWPDTNQLQAGATADGMTASDLDMRMVARLLSGCCRLPKDLSKQLGSGLTEVEQAIASVWPIALADFGRALGMVPTAATAQPTQQQQRQQQQLAAGPAAKQEEASPTASVQLSPREQRHVAASEAGSAGEQESASTATWPRPSSEEQQQQAAAAKAADHMAQLLMVCIVSPWNLRSI